MKNQVICGDCLDVMRRFPPNTFDTVITDPPYELGFMGKSWDSTGIAYNPDLWRMVLRILKPGGHLLSFGGSRTYHRMACAIEDAGFEIRDQIMWVYGSGYPKSLNIGKAVDKLQGNKREVVGDWKPTGTARPNKGGSHSCAKTTADCGYDPDTEIRIPITKGTSEWEGYGTALKPAHEIICLARKPISEKTVAENCLKWGVGGLNIDGCRVGTEARFNKKAGNPTDRDTAAFHAIPNPNNYQGKEVQGRWPANLIHDGSEEVMDLFPNTGNSSVRKISETEDVNIKNQVYGKGYIRQEGGFNDSGSAARFFYSAKASKSERGEGNRHPTVKPLALMEYLCRLTKTPTGGIVLDPFAGSGTTALACIHTKRNYILIEKEPAYVEICKARIAQAETGISVKEQKTGQKALW